MGIETMPDNAALATQCRSAGEALSAAVEWVGRNRERVRADADSLVKDLRKEALTARKLETAALRKMCAGVFGPSQAGKSYLISALARPGQEPVMVEFGGEARDFIREINPEGGRESTGLVTRFTLDRPAQSVPGFPVELRLLSQTDLIKIIGNTYYADCKHDDWPDPQPAEIAERLESLSRVAGSSPVDPLTEDDVYDLEDYLWRAFRGNGRIKVLKNTGFWSHAAPLAPRLGPADRARLFALVWGDVPEFTNLYLSLYRALQALGFAAVAHAPPAALIPREHSIIDVQTLSGLGSGGGDRLTVSALGRPVDLTRTDLTALTAELRVVLQRKPCDAIEGKPYDFFDHTDLLDFPGARSREQIGDLAAQLAKPDALQSFFLRGKVAYLFERYCAEQELTSMLLCIGPSNQEVKGLPRMVDDWVAATHGATPEERTGRPVALFLVLTKFDMEFEQKAGNEGSASSRWSIRLHASLLDFFGKEFAWPRQWDRDGPFRNSLWLRNPNFKQKAIFDYDGDRERQVRPAEEGFIADLRAGFLGNAEVQHHVADPARAWDAAMVLNDGGVRHLAERLHPVCNPDLKRRQVGLRLAGIARTAGHRLRPYFVSGDLDAERARKRELARALARKLAGAAAQQRFGELLAALHVTDEALYEVCFLADSPPLPGAADTPAPPSAAPDTVGGGIDADALLAAIFGDEAPVAAAPTAAVAPPLDEADRYANEIMSHWASHLHGLSEDAAAQQYFGFSPAEFAALVHELVLGAHRLRLRPVIAQAVRDIFQFRNIRRERLVWKQAATTAHRLNGFVNWLGFDAVPENAGRPVITIAGRPRPIFATRPPVSGDGPALGPTPSRYDQDYCADWIAALTQLIDANVAAIQDTAVDIEQNRRLGTLLATLDRVSA